MNDMLEATTHPDATAGTSQCDLILALLLARAGQWVGIPELYHVSGSFVVHSRIADLRRRGHWIENRTTRHGSQTCSEYRIRTREKAESEKAESGNS